MSDCDPRPYGGLSAADSALQQLQQRSDYPLSVTLALTEACNLRCEHCFLVPPTADQVLTEQDVTRLLQELADCGVLALTITGGEPVLSPLLERTVAVAGELNFAIRLKTSGTLFTSAKLERLFELGVAYLDVSLYHDLEAAHDKFVGLEGAWRKTVTAATRFRELGGWVQVSMIALHWNVERIAAMRELCEQHDLNLLVTTALHPRVDGNRDNSRHQLNDEQVSALHADTALFDTEGLLQALPQDPKNRSFCTAGSDSPFVAPNGDVRLCQLLPWALGNVRDERFRDIWLGSKRRQWFANMRWSELPDCSDCEAFSVCTRCAASAMFESGDVLGVASYDCVLARSRLKELKRRRRR